MKGILKHNSDCFDVFITGNINDNDEFLGTALKYLKDNGYSVHLEGFDKYNRPLVNINGVLHTADKNLASCIVERFINVKRETLIDVNPERYNKILKYMQ